MSGSDIKSSVTSDTFWLRTFYTVIFFVISRVLDLILIVLTVIQWAFHLVSGSPNATLSAFGYSLGEYYKQVVCYLTGQAEEKPYPFADWPIAPTTTREEERIE